jgi:hypothetical protein
MDGILGTHSSPSRRTCRPVRTSTSRRLMDAAVLSPPPIH